MKKVKLVLIVLLLLGIVPVVKGCSNNKEKQFEVVKNKDSRGVVDDFSDKVFLNGKKVNIPTTLNELGDEYTFGNKEYFLNFKLDNGITYVAGKLLYKGEGYASIILYNTNKENMERDSIICEVVFFSSSNGNYALHNLRKGASRTEVEKVLGEPMIDNGSLLQYYNKKDAKEEWENNRILINITDNKMTSLTFGRDPKE